MFASGGRGTICTAEITPDFEVAQGLPNIAQELAAIARNCVCVCRRRPEAREGESGRARNSLATDSEPKAHHLPSCRTHRTQGRGHKRPRVERNTPTTSHPHRDGLLRIAVTMADTTPPCETWHTKPRCWWPIAGFCGTGCDQHRRTVPLRSVRLRGCKRQALLDR